MSASLGRFQGRLLAGSMTRFVPCLGRLSAGRFGHPVQTFRSACDRSHFLTYLQVIRHFIRFIDDSWRVPSLDASNAQLFQNLKMHPKACCTSCKPLPTSAARLSRTGKWHTGRWQY